MFVEFDNEFFPADLDGFLHGLKGFGQRYAEGLHCFSVVGVMPEFVETLVADDAVGRTEVFTLIGKVEGVAGESSKEERG